MMPEPDARKTLAKTAVWLIVGTALVVVCYYFVDRPVAFYVHRHELNQYRLFKWLTYPPPWVQAWSPLFILLLVLRRVWGPFSSWQKTLLVALVSLIVADQFRTSLGDICGRYWPETWFDNNPSLIGTDSYGFHPFQHGDDIGSFPSGHAARIASFAGVWWLAMPRLRPVLIVVCLPMLVSLVAMNYHFVGDVVAGSILGGIVAGYATLLASSEWSSR